MSDSFLLNQRSLAFAEDLIFQPEYLRQARTNAVADGVDAVSNGVITALSFFAKLIGAKNVVEVGTGSGVTGLALFAGMTENGVLTSIDSQADLQNTARKIFKENSITFRQLRLIPGVPLDVLDNLRDNAYDLVLLNGNKLEYVEYLEHAQRLLRPGGLVIINDALWHNLVAERSDESDESLIIRETLESLINNEAFTSLMIPLGEGLVVARLNA